jgi:hypothetical protein
MRRSKDGWPPIVKVGYGRARASRGLHPSGLREILVWSPKDLEGLDPKTQVARIGHTVGEKKRVQILDEAKKTNIRILNAGLKKPTEPEVAQEPASTGKVDAGKEEAARSSATQELTGEKTETEKATRKSSE